MKLRQIALVGSLLFVLVGCGNDSPIVDPAPNPNPNPSPNPNPTIPTLPTNPSTPTGSTIAGTVTVTPAGDVSGTVIIACSDEACATPVVAQATSTGTYSLADLQAVPYTLVAFKDVDNNQDLSNGDYIGVYTQDGENLTPVTPPATGVNIEMFVYSSGTTPTNPVDPAPTEGGSIAGTVTAPSGVTVSGAAAVYACYYTGSSTAPCDNNLSGIVEIQLTSSSSAYSINDLSAGQYYILALVDTDGNDAFDDATDLLGFYPSLDAPELVSPPATGIDITLVAYGDVSSAATPRAAGMVGASAAKAFASRYQTETQLKRALRNIR